MTFSMVPRNVCFRAEAKQVSTTDIRRVAAWQLRGRRDLRGVIEREDAEMGLFVSLAEPTLPMAREAADAGFVARSAHGRLPRIQIATIEDLLSGRLPKLPPLPIPERKLTASIRRKDKDQLELLLPFEGEKVVPAKGVVVDPRFIALAG